MTFPIRSSHTRSNALAIAVIFLSLLSSRSGLRASTKEAWEAFRKDVSARMEAAVKGKLEKYTITVEPFGTQSYGVALATGLRIGDKAPMTMVGIYDKKTEKFEVAEFPMIKKRRVGAAKDRGKAPEKWEEWARWVEGQHSVGDGKGHGPDVGSDEWASALNHQLEISDKAGHGPDPGSAEWRRAVERALKK